MNQEQIEEYLDKMLKESEDELQAVFAGRMKALFDHLGEIFRKYKLGEEASRTDVYKTKRFQNEMELIKKNLHEDYKEIYKIINDLMKSQYVDNYLRSNYVYEMTLQTQIFSTVPTTQAVVEAITNPIDKLKLNALMNEHRNYIVNRIRIELAQGIQAGESYSQIAERLEKAVKFSRSKAMRVARTESGRTQTLGRLKSIEDAEQYSDRMKRFWMAELDARTRQAHRKLDGQLADENNNFRWRGRTAKGPSLWGIASMDINCRCDVGLKVAGKMPDTRRVKDYDDADYQRRLAERTEEIMANEGKTEKQAERKAKRQVFPPSKIIKWQTYEQWYKDLKDRA
ncbi:phage minor head protein [Halobacillus karajensis]|uniref:NAD(+)--arginine ADP-ribosyltransferase EFV n=1 Tax=Halobacillus karajensis TaxID=195088 RepID=A0A059NUX9_9BACI|nr:phage minor head protein [Halobacillus karajensis]CDQ22579.1 NAD(+)--arginine ADP-ribosyltransferase EFV [Halobacillus karajensis]CDQ26061.1 NAD(+)--arginine ADP-ribosyltransferase EFV [Halobacillus karajensis]